MEGAIAPLSPSSAARFGGGIGHVGPTALPHFAYAEQSAEQSAIDDDPSTSNAGAVAQASGGTDNISASCHIDRLPDELLLKICAYLLEGDLCRMARTGQRMYRICNDTKVW